MFPRLKLLVALAWSCLLLGRFVRSASADHRHHHGSALSIGSGPLLLADIRGGGRGPSLKKTQDILKETGKKAKTVISKESAKSPSQIFKVSDHYDAIKGCIILTGLERGINKLFVKYGIAFPAQLAGCIGLFFFMILSEILKPGFGVSVYKFFVPGSDLLAKWFPVLFVPGLVMLPLAPSIGNGWEVAKFMGVAIVGLFYSMLTTAYTVLFLRKAQGKLATPPAPPRGLSKTTRMSAQKILPTFANKPKAYRDETMTFLIQASLLSGVISVALRNQGNDLSNISRTIFLTLTTFCTYVWGARLPVPVTKVIHPLIISALLTMGVIQGSSLAMGLPFKTYLKNYKVGTYQLFQMGAGDVMMFLLGPSVVSFSMSMFDRRKLLQENLAIVLISVMVSSVGGLFGTAAFVRCLQLGGKIGGGMIRLSTLSRNVTTALAIACTNVLKGDVSLAILIVLTTGVLGATICRSVLDSLGIYDPITRGLAVGGSAQGLGVTSMIPEPDAFPFAAMSMILTAISATVMVSIPSIRDSLVTLAQGNL